MWIQAARDGAASERQQAGVPALPEIRDGSWLAVERQPEAAIDEVFLFGQDSLPGGTLLAAILFAERLNNVCPRFI